MGKINDCLKWVFITFNLLFAIIGCLLIFVAIKNSTVSGQFSSDRGWVFWAIDAGVLVISCFGVYAGYSEKDLALKFFAGFMAAGMIAMLIFGSLKADERKEMLPIRRAFTDATPESAKLHMGKADFRKLLMEIQSIGRCCGLSAAEDWGSEIPDSCTCDESSEGFGRYGSNQCKVLPWGTIGPRWIFASTCQGDHFQTFDHSKKIVMGFLFGFAVTALLGLLATLLMLHQIRRHDARGRAIFMT